MFKKIKKVHTNTLLNVKVTILSVILRDVNLYGFLNERDWRTKDIITRNLVLKNKTHCISGKVRSMCAQMMIAFGQVTTVTSSLEISG